MIRKQLVTDQRVDSLESSLRMRKMALAAGGSTSGDDASSNILKMALANVFQKEGRSDAFAMAGLSTAEGTLIQESTKKAMDSGTGGAGGGFVIPQQWWAQFIEALRARLTVVAAGATIMENLSGIPVSIPKQLSSSSVSWIGQNSTIPLSDATLGQVLLTPKTMAIRTQFSNLLGMLSTPGTEQIVRRDFQKVAALELDRVALRGLGVSGQPLGLNEIGRAHV